MGTRRRGSSTPARVAREVEFRAERGIRARPDFFEGLEAVDGTQFNALLLPDPTTALLLAADLLDPGSDIKASLPKLLPYENDPVGFVRRFINWEGENSLAPYQEDILREMGVPNTRLAVRGPHGLGKTTVAALLVLWFALTRDGRYDWKIVTTASAWRQLQKYLWPEVKKWVRKLKWQELDRAPFSKRELLDLEIHLTTGRAFAAASDDPSNIEGAHADRLLYIFDESREIPAESWDAIEGAFSGAGADTNVQANALAISTPGAPNGRFYDIHAQVKGFERWKTKHVTLDEAVKAGRVSREWADETIRQYGGENSVMAQRRVFGNFAQDSTEGVIPLAWVEEAMRRWETMQPVHPITKELLPLTRISVDVARGGTDSTIICLRHGPWFDHLIEVESKHDGVEIASICKMHLMRWGRRPEVCVDVIGVGASVYDELNHDGFDVWGFNASHGTQQLDIHGQLGFENARAAAWWTMRQALDPDNGFLIALPYDRELIGDLTAPLWKIGRTGRILIESKDSIRKRIGRSTDRGDAVVMSLAYREEEFTEATIFDDTRVMISNF